MPDIGSLELLHEQLETLWRFLNDPAVGKLIVNSEEFVRPCEALQQQRLAVALIIGGLAQYLVAQGFEPKLLAPIGWVKTAALEAVKGTRHPLFEPEMPHSRPLEPLIASKTAARACVLVKLFLDAGNTAKKASEKVADKLNAGLILPPEAYGPAGREAATPRRWNGRKVLRLWQENERIGKLPRQARPRGQATIRREFYEAEWRNSEGLAPADMFARVLPLMTAEQGRTQ